MRNVILLLVALVLFSCNSKHKQNKSYDSIEKIAQDQIRHSAIDSNGVDSLRKYSYRIQLLRDGKVLDRATGFFVRKNNKLLLLSCAHVFLNINTENAQKKDSNRNTQPNEMAIIFINAKTGLPVYKTFNISSFYNSVKPFYSFDKPDLYIYEFKNSISDVKVYSIESFLKESAPKNKYADYVSSYGCANTNKSGIYSELHSFQMKTMLSDFIKVPTLINNKPVKVINGNSYLISPASIGGMSGSPVFLKYSAMVNGITQSKIFFGGLIHSHGLKNNICFVVKPSEVERALSLF